MSIYIIKLRHDHGQVRIRAIARSIEDAISLVMKVEGCPSSSVLNVYKLRERKTK
jgi:hypothetical protein